MAYLVIGGNAHGTYHTTKEPTRFILSSSSGPGGVLIRQRYEYRLLDWGGHPAPCYVLSGMADQAALDLLRTALESDSY